ncbi:efflux RND transporter periplasmic adaptor subunit [Wukongibacter baidiensis]|uniref:efflux RND transporter periplasmic adaptor subunit n=1 Tax=Wukongibacter baidiensis TaxID=1723361 RepID=UPI003D7F7D6C
MKKRKFVIIGLTLLSMIVSAYFITKAKGLIEVETFNVSQGDIASYIEETAIVKSDSQRIVYAKAAGEVVKLNVDVGDKVNKGDIIIEKDTKEIDFQIKGLEAKIESLIATYAEAVKPSERELIDKAEANVNTNEILVNEAKREVERNKKLYDGGAISHDSYQKALDSLELKNEGLRIAKNELLTLQKEASKNIKKQYESQISELEYQLEILKINKENSFVKAPIDGTVVELFVKEGSYLQIGTQMVEIGDEANLYLEVDVLVEEIEDIDVGNKVLVYSDDIKMKGLTGNVSKVYPKAFSKTSDLGIEQKRVKLEVELDKKSDYLKIGYEIRAKIILDQKKDTLIIPNGSIFDYEDGKYVFVVENDVVSLRKIETGIEGEETIEILSGLKSKEEIILNPTKDIEEGIKVEQANNK